jgi:L-lactate dehydrogenase complex protein LldG
MATSIAKENILRKIRQALRNPVPLPFSETEHGAPIFIKSPEEDLVLFAETFNKLQGNFSYCTNIEDLKNQLAQLFIQRAWSSIYCIENPYLQILQELKIQTATDLSSCDVSITGCEYLVARTGTIVMSSAQSSGRTTSVYAPIHICIAFTNQLVYDLKDSLSNLKSKYEGCLPSMITFASGPSRTADIEKTLVTGVHGPKEVFCFLIES